MATVTRPAPRTAPATSEDAIAAIKTKIATARRQLADAILEKEPDIDLAMTALFCPGREHVLFISVPGTAKSMLARSIASWIGGTKAELLLTKFTEPDELTGRLDILALREGKYSRFTKDKFVTAQIFFADEIN